MKRIILILFLGLTAFAATAKSKVVTDSIAVNRLGVQQKYNVYLPSGYKETGHYPVIYLLHGLWGCYRDWVELGQMERIADLLMASGECVPTVIVMPNARDADVHNYQCGYINVEGWPFEDFFFVEFLPQVEA